MKRDGPDLQTAFSAKRPELAKLIRVSFGQYQNAESDCEDAMRFVNVSAS
jgi:hypothetical protein